MACTDCFLIASDFEGTSLSLMEAMSNGLPILASDVPGLRDMITDGHNGLLFGRKDAASLKQCLLRYFKDPGLRVEMGNNAFADFTENYSFETVLNRYLDIL
jgi:glycosyltransferase involved in cell wall biosynthesis